MSVQRADFAAVTLSSGKVLLIGGESSLTIDTATVDLFDSSTNTMTAAAPMKTPRNGHSATPLPNGKVLVAGGNSAPNGPALASAELYDPATDSWTPAASMTQARSHHAAVLMNNGKVFVAGGDALGQPYLPGNEIYDPETNTWTGAQSVYAKRPDGPTATVLRDGRVLIYGGVDSIQPGNQYELYDPTTGRSSSGCCIPDEVNYATAALMADGTVFIVGGQASYNPGGPLNTTLIYDPSQEGRVPATAPAWAPGPAMNFGRCHHTMTTFRGGLVFVAGGGRCGGAAPIAYVDIYDPAGKRWEPPEAMLYNRSNHVAVLLSDGRILLAGGFITGSTPVGNYAADTILATTEIYRLF